jgi:hypothetical protein
MRGQVKDELGAVIVGATVTAVNASNVEKTATTNGEGNFAIAGLSPGKYTVRAFKEGFALYEATDVDLSTGQSATLNIELRVALKDEKVTISSNDPNVSVDPANNANSLVLRGSDLDLLSDDPDQLAEDLKALAGGLDGPNGTQILVDGFSRTSIPSKSSILEVKINSNPFTAEQDSLGFGRIEITTKAGTEKFNGQGFFNFNDESLNARNPYAPNRAPYQARLFGAQVSGPVITKKSSYFFDFEKRDIDENAIINALILDPSFNIVPFGQAVVTPQRRTNFSARFDYQLNKNNTFVGRYNILHATTNNSGLGGFSLPTRAFNSSLTEQTLQFSNTMVVNPSTLNITRFQYIRSRRNQESVNAGPTINVQEAFIGGGAPFDFALNDTDRYELHNQTTWIQNNHTWIGGARLRLSRINDVSPNNFAGTFIFSSLQEYRRVLQGIPGARPAQFTIAGGNPQARVNQFDLGGFLQDDWRLKPNFTLSLGLRFESQTNIGDKIDLAPRVAFAWAPWGANNGKRPRTVIRGGGGIFYTRVDEELTLQADRFNGINQQRFIVSGPNFFPNVPATQTLLAASLPQTTRLVSPDLKTPYSMKGVFSVERQLPHGLTLTVAYLYGRDRQLLRSRNLNAPLPGTFDPAQPNSGVRPFGNVGNIFAFESGGDSTSQTLILNLRGNLTKKLNLTMRYGVGRVKGDTEGAFTFPSNPYDFSQDDGFQSYASTQGGVFGLIYRAPLGISITPLVRFNSAERFNITLGRDLNGDGVFTERPAFATDLSKPGVVVTKFGAFDTNPSPGQAIIPRNFGKGADYFHASLRFSKLFGFGTVGGPAAAAQSGGNGAKSTEKRYYVLLTMQVQNLFNNRNQGTFIGNLSSPLFGQSNSLNGTARRVEFQARFSF